MSIPDFPRSCFIMALSTTPMKSDNGGAHNPTDHHFMSTSIAGPKKPTLEFLGFCNVSTKYFPWKQTYPLKIGGFVQMIHFKMVPFFGFSHFGHISKRLPPGSSQCVSRWPTEAWGTSGCRGNGVHRSHLEKMAGFPVILLVMLIYFSTKWEALFRTSESSKSQGSYEMIFF